MRLLVSDKYPQVYRLATQGAPKFSPVATGGFVGLAPKTKLHPQIEMWNNRNQWFLSIPILFCPVVYGQSSTCRRYVGKHRLIIFGTFVRW